MFIHHRTPCHRTLSLMKSLATPFLHRTHCHRTLSLMTSLVAPFHHRRPWRRPLLLIFLQNFENRSTTIPHQKMRRTGIIFHRHYLPTSQVYECVTITPTLIITTTTTTIHIFGRIIISGTDHECPTIQRTAREDQTQSPESLQANPNTTPNKIADTGSKILSDYQR